MTELPKNIRVHAANYAQRFLAKKYSEEYQELYRAYLINRGANVRNPVNPVDERLLLKGNDNGK
jgi:hypothetical protein